MTRSVGTRKSTLASSRRLGDAHTGAISDILASAAEGDDADESEDADDDDDDGDDEATTEAFVGA
jgi:hypothetical protein